MAGSGVSSYRAQGDVIIERLKELKLPKELSEVVKDFIARHTAYGAAAEAVKAAEKKRDAALAEVAKADAEGLDPSVESLADAMVGASMGKRKNPFQGFSTYSPSALKDLAYADEVKEVRELIGKVREAKPTAAVTKALDASGSWAEKVTERLKALTLAQTRYDVALSARDKLLPAWTRSLARLKKKAVGAWADEEETYAAVFAPPDAVRAPVAKRPKKKPATP